MERNISPAAILCIVLVSLACVIGIGYGAFAITKGSANDGTQEVATQTSEASSSWKSTYNDTEVTGAQVQSLLSEADSRGIAVFVNTRGMTQSKINAQSEVPVLKHNGKYYMNYGTVFDYEDESYKKMSGEVDLSSNSGLLQVRDGSSLKVAYNPKLDNGQIVKNKDYTGLYSNGAINYIDTHAKFKSNLIYGNNGEVIGVILSQSNRAGVTTLPLSTGGGGSTSSGSSGTGSNSKPNFSNNVSYGNIPVTPNWTSGSGGDDTTGDSSTEGDSSGDGVTTPEEKAYFYIDSVIYEAPSYATTWSEWVESENNTIGIKILDGYLVTEDYKIINSTTTYKPVVVNDSVTNCKRYVSEVETLKFTLYEYGTNGDIKYFDYLSNMTWEDFVNSSYNKGGVFTTVQNSSYSNIINVKYYNGGMSWGHIFGALTSNGYILGSGNKGNSVYYQGFAPSDGIPRGPVTENFSIDSVSYEMFEGFGTDDENWWHWVNSRLNTCGAIILADGRIFINGSIVQHYSNGNDVLYTDEISSDKNYKLKKLPSFTITNTESTLPEIASSTTLYFEEGMTWREWVDSDYDTFGVSIWTIMGYESVRYDANGVVALSQNRSTAGIAPDDVLVNGATYYLWDTSD